MNFFTEIIKRPDSAVKAAILCLFVFCLSACPPEPEDDMTIGEITISNIPVSIPVFGSDSLTNPTFKIYVNASNYMDDDKPPAALGFLKITSDMLEDNTYTVTIQLLDPVINLKPDKYGNESEYNPEPYNPLLPIDANHGPWKGTANFFSVMISPEDVTDGVKTIYAKGGIGLDKSKACIKWENKVEDNKVDLMDFRDSGNISSLGTDKKTLALFEDIVKRDTDITK